MLAPHVTVTPPVAVIAIENPALSYLVLYVSSPSASLTHCLSYTPLLETSFEPLNPVPLIENVIPDKTPPLC